MQWHQKNNQCVQRNEKQKLIKKMLLTSVKKIGIIQKPVLGIQLNNTNKHMIKFISKGKIKNNNGYLISKVLKDLFLFFRSP